MHEPTQFQVSKKLIPVVAVMIGMTVASIAKAQVNVDRLYPPAVKTGESTIVTAEGKFPVWPAEVVCDRDDVTFVAQKDAGKWSVQVSPDARPGVAWVRFFDPKAASDLLPILVSRVPVHTESEPNDRRSQAGAVELPVNITGKLGKGGDSDAYRVLLGQGDRLLACVTANEVLAAPMDAVLQVTDLSGNVLAQTDDVRGLDPQILYQADRDGDVIVRVFAFPETPNSTIGFGGSPAFVYALELTKGAFLDHVAAVDLGVIPFGYGIEGTPMVHVSRSSGSLPSVA